MNRTKVAEAAALTLTLALVGAFVVSFVTGLGGGAREAATASIERPTLPAADPGRDPRGRVEVFNATKKAGVARDATVRLRDAGFDVVNFANASIVPDSSRVIDRIGRPDIARAIASELGITRVITVLDSTLYVDASVILGVDWKAKR
jgi:LytR cell envelope-related transcriptional attenuator